jgi:asparagine synthase (glutamine-hydrolysing)
VPSPLRTLAAATVPRLLRDSERSRNLGDWSRRFLTGSRDPLPDRYIGWTRFFGDAALRSLVSPAVREAWHEPVDEAQRAAWAGHHRDDPVDGAFRIDLATYLPDDLLVMADRMSMAHSLELRAPFCDHVLVERSLGLTSALKLRGWSLKALLRSAFADVLPRAVLTHRKQGFMIPLARWLRTDLRPTLEDLLAPERVRARGVFAPEEVSALMREHLDGRRSHADRLWTLMMAELWMRLYLDTNGTWSGRT